MRTILVHLNVEVPDTDTRTADEIADAILNAHTVGSDDDSVADLDVACTLAEEVVVKTAALFTGWLAICAYSAATLLSQYADHLRLP